MEMASRPLPQLLLALSLVATCGQALANEVLFKQNMITAVQHGKTAAIRATLDRSPEVAGMSSTQFFVYADPNREARFITQLLMEACGSRNVSVELVELLIDFGADPHYGESDGLSPAGPWTPLSRAVMNVNDIWANSPALKSSIQIGTIPAESASTETRLAVISLLIDQGADVNHGDGKLLQIALNNSLPAARLLLERGADPTIVRPDTGESVLASAVARRQRLGEHLAALQAAIGESGQ
jgi:hypothetical protein